MFVDAPLPRKKREDLKRKADEVRDEMLKKADPEFLNLLKEKGIGNLDGAQVEVDEKLGDDWVRVQMDKDEEVEIAEGGADSTLTVVSPSDSRLSAKDLISQFDEKRKVPEKKPSEPKPPRKEKRARKKSKEPVKEPVRARKGPQEKQVDVINIVEQGVYEIDVQRLLEDNPIVIQKDGSYLIHLPSLFKEGRDKPKK